MPPKETESAGPHLSPRPKPNTSLPQQQQQSTPSVSPRAARAAPAKPKAPRVSATRDDLPRWLYPSLAVVVVLLTAVIGTALMVATPDELDAAWQYRRDLLSMRFWRRVFSECQEAVEDLFFGAGSADDSLVGPGMPSPETMKRAASLSKNALKQAPPPETVERARLNGKGEQPAETAPMETSGARDEAPLPVTCFTLEAYSDHFIATERQKTQGKHLFRCGTRLVDIRTLDPKSAAAVACAVTSQVKEHPSSHRYLRVVLTAKEKEWHTWQKRNLAVEVFPLHRLNDNYCDCLDGTDEMLTGACSMSGPGMPLGMERWRAYVVANKDIPLYEDQIDDSKTPSASTKSQSGTKAKTGGQRVKSSLELYAMGGPVLPFACSSDPDTWLSPTMVGDGIVDCCDGSDESVAAWTTVHGDTFANSEEDDGGPAHRPVLEVLRQEALAQWEQQRTGAPEFLSNSTSYVDAVHPHYTSAAALLVDKGYTSLFSCPNVHSQQLASAQILLDIARKGYATMLERERDGWERLGKAILQNQTNLAERLGNTTRAIQTLRRRFVDTMEKRQTTNPIEAGIDPAELQHYEELEHQEQFLKQESSYLSLIVTQRVFGEHYEYYPLFVQTMSVHWKNVVNSFATDAVAERRRKARRRMSVKDCMQRQKEVTMYDRYAAEARAQGAQVPPRPLPLHVDNVSVSAYVVIPARLGLVLQHMRTPAEEEMVARAKGFLAQDEPYDKERLAEKYDKTVLSPAFALGHWQPYRVDRNASVMAMLDPAGDVDLPRRFSVAPVSRLTRGGGRLQIPTRKKEKNRVFVVNEPEDTNARKKPQEEEETKGYELPLMYHRNTPNVLATHNFEGGSLRCGLDHDVLGENGNSEDSMTSMRVAYGCAEYDGILAWARNGKCNHEVLIGTPSACTRWVLREAEQRVDMLRALIEAQP